MRKPLKKINNPKSAKRLRRKLSIRKKIEGTPERPRVCATKTNKHLNVQVIDDSIGKTLFTVKTYGKNAVQGRSNKEGAKAVGAKLSEVLKEKNLTNVVFDRNGNVYTGVVAVVAATLRENGIRV